MEIELITGKFSTEDAEQLLTKLVNIKIAFHREKLKIISLSEEQIKLSENRIMKLEKTLKDAIRKLKANNIGHINIHAQIEVTLPPQIGQ